MALGQVTVSYPPVIPKHFPESLKDFILKFVTIVQFGIVPCCNLFAVVVL